MKIRILFFLYFVFSTPFLSFSQCPELKIERRKWSDYFGYLPNHLTLTNDSSSVLITGGVIVEWDSIRLNNQDSVFTHIIDNLECRRDGNSFYQEILFSDAEREIIISLGDCNYLAKQISNRIY